LTDVALVTCRDLPEWEIDDRFLRAALRDIGVTFDQPVWCDPAVRWEAYTCVLLRTPWDYHLRLTEFLEWAERISQVTRLLNPLATIEWNAHKRYLDDLVQYGVPVMPTVQIGRATRPDLQEHVAHFADTFGVARCVLKPAVSATAHETLPFDLDDQGMHAAHDHLRRLLPHHDLILQPWCDAVCSEGEYSLITVEGTLTHAVRKVPRTGDFRVQDDFGAHDEPWTPSDEALAIMRAALRTLEPDVLYARIDCLRAPDDTLRLSEFELIEPSLFFRHGPAAAPLLAKRLAARLTI